jgi:dipeptidyl aminopeptidase/acylaminoacyl peptidase
MSLGSIAGRAVFAFCSAAAVYCGGQDAVDRPSSSPLPATAGRFEARLQGAGVELGGIVFRPEATGAPLPALVVLHGWQPVGTNGAALVEARARRYSEQGYVALALSMRGWPPSGGADDCGLKQPDDVTRAVEWLAALPGVDAARVGLVGFSQGGQVALLAGGRGARARAIVVYYPVTDVALWEETTTNPDIPAYIAAICEPAAPRSPVLHAGPILAPVLLVHGDLDTRVPTEQSERMHEALGSAGRSSRLLLVAGAAHGFTTDQEAVARPVVDEFLSSQLR